MTVVYELSSRADFEAASRVVALRARSRDRALADEIIAAESLEEAQAEHARKKASRVKADEELAAAQSLLVQVSCELPDEELDEPSASRVRPKTQKERAPRR